MQQQNLVGSFVSHATSHPGDPALVWHGEETTYRELHRLAERERVRIARLAPGEDEPIGILAAKSPSAIALVLACLLEGRRFLLLPAPTPEGRTPHALVEQAGIRHVLSPESPQAPGPGPGASDRPAEPKAPRRTEPADVSFMFTTSGSTGRPKIVPLSTGAVDRFTTWAGERFGIRRGTTVLNYAPLTFDLCLLDIWTTLKYGGRVVLVDPARATHPGHLLDLVSRHAVQLVQAVPMFYRLLVDAATESGRRLDTVEHVVFTGDSMPARCLAEFPQLFTGARFYNVYGCTETNDSFLHEVDGTEPADGPVPIGRPLPGVHAVIVGADGGILTGPGTGELQVTTPFQTDGYLDREQDADTFATHHHDGETRRYFRSGDLVRRDRDGRITLEGRNDHQVKVRGVRVNTHEVEQVLLDHPDVVEAAVVAVPDPVAGRLLRSVVRRAPDSRLNSLALRRHCAQRLPLTAVPSALLIVDDPLPRTSTGKIDRRPVERACSPSQPNEGTAT
ncbi:amino acid adenylation domain-containing protein [Kitasatospora sp. MAA19]|uniref:AMP-binding protein n=1 Tax=Kitasatospora sp. MAA19 TaxID=3035090 RepID=UPI002474A901|nr:AMP-binding protein [Kitasatospora sp. MAA19]MDH6707867.1 amino acid adenylation domain-containing protein [Kitasatospora sp. MAA19]